MALVDDPHGRFQGGQVAQAEEVHLEQPGLLDVAHVPLGADDLVLVAPADDLKRNQGLERLVGDHHARGVRAGVSRGTLEPLREPDQPFDLGILLDHRAQGRLFLEGVLERDVEPGRNQPVDLLDPRQGNAQHPAHVLDRRLGLHRAEGANLGHVGVAVLLPDVVDHLVAPLLAEVDVDIGRLGAIGVEKPLEQQVVLDRADIAEVQGVADQGAACRPAPTPGCRARERSGRSPRRSGNRRRSPCAGSHPARGPAAPGPRAAVDRRSACAGLARRVLAGTLPHFSPRVPETRETAACPGQGCCSSPRFPRQSAPRSPASHPCREGSCTFLRDCARETGWTACRRRRRTAVCPGAGRASCPC